LQSYTKPENHYDSARSRQQARYLRVHFYFPTSVPGEYKQSGAGQGSRSGTSSRRAAQSRQPGSVLRAFRRPDRSALWMIVWSYGFPFDLLHRKRRCSLEYSIPLWGRSVRSRVHSPHHPANSFESRSAWVDSPAYRTPDLRSPSFAFFQEFGLTEAVELPFSGLCCRSGRGHVECHSCDSKGGQRVVPRA